MLIRSARRPSRRSTPGAPQQRGEAGRVPGAGIQASRKRSDRKARKAAGRDRVTLQTSARPAAESSPRWTSAAAWATLAASSGIEDPLRGWVGAAREASTCAPHPAEGPQRRELRCSGRRKRQRSVSCMACGSRVVAGSMGTAVCGPAWTGTSALALGGKVGRTTRSRKRKTTHGRKWRMPNDSAWLESANASTPQGTKL